MSSLLRLSWRHVTWYRWRSLVLALGVALTLLLPFAVGRLVERYGEQLAARADATPLVCGAPGSRYDLVLSALYFRGRTPRLLAMREVDELQRSGLARAIPLSVRHRAQGFPVVATTPDYLAFRDLWPAAGTPPLFIGEAALGADVARELGLAPGDTLLSDRETLYDLTRYPLRMHVTGVFAPSGTPDDGAVFVDLKTGWILDGLGHGHAPADEQPDEQVLARTDERVVLNASIVEAYEITAENRGDFHLHGDPADLPLTGVLVVPHDAKSSTLLKGRYRVSEAAQLLVPREVIDELLGFVLRLKVFFDANGLLVGCATALFLGVVLLLSVQVRRREIETLVKIGCSRATVAALLGCELGLVVLGGVLLAAGGAALLLPLLSRSLGLR